MIFCILGTQDKKFPRLIEAIEREVKNNNIKEKVIVQAGQTKYETEEENIEIIDFISPEDFEKYIKESNFIITHAGVGTILTALNFNKKIIAVARLKKYKEHVNDHQLELLESFEKEGYIIPCYDLENLNEEIKKVKDFKPNKFKSNKDNFIKLLKEEIDK